MDGLAFDYHSSDLFEGMYMMSERDVRLEAAEIAFDKALLQYETLDRLHDLNIHEAELQCYAESADTDTYLSYMEAANEQASEKKQSALLKLWDRVKQLFQALIAKFFGKDKGKDLPKDEKFAVPKPFAFFIKKIKSLVAGAKSAITNTNKKLSENPKWKALVVAIGAVAAIGALKIHHVRKNKRLERETDQLHNRSLSMDVANTVIAEANKRAQNKGLETDDSGLNFYMKNEDITYISGIELNEGYSSLSDFFNMCVHYSDSVMDHYSKKFGSPKIPTGRYTTHEEFDADRAKELEKITKDLKPVLDSMVFVRRKVDFTVMDAFNKARDAVNKGAGERI